MPLRQVWLFQLGCWAAFGAAALHLVAHVAITGGLSPHAAEGLSASPATHLIAIPGIRQPTLQGMVDGFSLGLSLLLATIGAAGLVVARYGHDDARLFRGVARAFTLGTAALLMVSIARFFSLDTFALAVVVTCFGLACVPEH